MRDVFNWVLAPALAFGLAWLVWGIVAKEVAGLENLGLPTRVVPAVGALVAALCVTVLGIGGVAALGQAVLVVTVAGYLRR